MMNEDSADDWSNKKIARRGHDRLKSAKVTAEYKTS